MTVHDVIAEHPGHLRFVKARADLAAESARRYAVHAKAEARHRKRLAEYDDALKAAGETGETPEPPPRFVPPVNLVELYSLASVIDTDEARWIAEHRAEMLDALAAEETTWFEAVALTVGILDRLADEGQSIVNQAAQIHGTRPDVWDGWQLPVDASALISMRDSGARPLRSTGQGSMVSVGYR